MHAALIVLVLGVLVTGLGMLARTGYVVAAGRPVGLLSLPPITSRPTRVTITAAVAGLLSAIGLALVGGVVGSLPAVITGALLALWLVAAGLEVGGVVGLRRCLRGRPSWGGATAAAALLVLGTATGLTAVTLTLGLVTTTG